MSDLPVGPDGVRHVLALARHDRSAAAETLAGLELEEQAALVCAAPVERRMALFDLLPEPESVIPLLPEAELCFTVKALGLESATWLLEYATPEQVVAALDLDVWGVHEPDPARLDAWLDALAATGDEPLERSLAAIDTELLVHWLHDRIAVFQKPNDDEGWQPPEGARTLEGQFYFCARREGDDNAAILRVLHLLFTHDYWSYFRLLQGVIHELPSDLVAWAIRWRTARLQDLGFPPWDEAIGLYRYLDADACGRLPEQEQPLDVAEWSLPVWIPGLPAAGSREELVFRAIAGLEEHERRAAFYAFVATANKVAVADGMDLSDSETTPRAIAKAARWISRGLEHVARANALDPSEVLRRASLAHLFRVGANLEPAAARPRVAAGDGPPELH